MSSAARIEKRLIWSWLAKSPASEKRKTLARVLGVLARTAESSRAAAVVRQSAGVA
jgi:hypothetical protein